MTKHNLDSVFSKSNIEEMLVKCITILIDTIHNCGVQYDSDDEEPRIPNEEEKEDIDYDSMTVPQLKEALKTKGLTVSGKKADLIARLKE